jgi:hypothetical protein
MRVVAIALVLGLALGACGTAPRHRPSPTLPVAGGARRGWLDQPLVNWNAPGETVPTAPPASGESPSSERCARLLRSPSGREDRAVAERGWSLIGALEVRDAIAVVIGSTAVDGMCRPLGYQGFVFLDGRFAGTVSPVPMDARTDGAETHVFLDFPMQVRVQYARYRDADPLCCPSRTSYVTFAVERDARGPVLVARDVVTTPAAPGAISRPAASIGLAVSTKIVDGKRRTSSGPRGSSIRRSV